jgi:hemerythrin-like domain-containing protein
VPLTSVLIAEHEAVLLALRILERVEAALDAGAEDAADHLGELVEFLRVFVDRCHHGKEEDVLFPELERLGVPRQGGPIGVMLAEHQEGRALVAAMADGLSRLHRAEPGAATRIAEAAGSYRGLLTAHIAKENGMLFPMAERVVPADLAPRLLERFEAIERDRIGPGRHEAFHEMLHRLRDHYALS